MSKCLNAAAAEAEESSFSCILPSLGRMRTFYVRSSTICRHFIPVSVIVKHELVSVSISSHFSPQKGLLQQTIMCPITGHCTWVRHLLGHTQALHQPHDLGFTVEGSIHAVVSCAFLHTPSPVQDQSCQPLESCTPEPVCLWPETPL